MSSSQTCPESPTRERQLGFYERFRVTLHDLGYHNNISIIARYTDRANILESSPQAVFYAFRHAVQEHPALGVTVTKDENGKLCFQRLKHVNLEELISFESLPSGQQDLKDRLIALSAEENNRGFKDTSSTPLWRAVVLRETSTSNIESSATFRIAFVWHHLIGDGRSGLAVHNTLLEAFASFGKDGSCKTDRPSEAVNVTRVPVSSKPMFISMEQALPESAASSVPVKTVQGEKWAGGSYNLQQPTITRLSHIRIPKANLQRILEACRSHGTTMTALLHAVVAKALLANIDQDRIRTAVAVSLRRFFSPTLKIDDSVMGLWIDAFTTEHHRSDYDEQRQPAVGEGESQVLWENSRKNTAKINEVVAGGGKEVELMAIMGVEDYEAALKPKAGQPRDNSFGLTNLGVFGPLASGKREQPQGLVIDDMLFSQSAHANGAAFQICIVSVRGCDMNIVFNWQEGNVSQEKMSAITEAVQACLLKLG